MFKIIWRGLKDTERKINAVDKRIGDAYFSAANRAGFVMRQKMLQEIKSRAPGGKIFEPLSYMRRRHGTGRLLPDKPYGMPHAMTGTAGPKMFSFIRYRAQRKEKGAEVNVGWVDIKFGKLSKRYKELAASLQEGFTRNVTERQRKMFARIGGKMSRRSRTRKYFFLKKTTTQFRTPGRPVIEPFARRYETEAINIIRGRFIKKMSEGRA